MKFQVFTASHGKFQFRIEEDLPEVGFYLYVFKDGKCIRDYLQDTIEVCKKMAFRMYGVPLDAWYSESESSDDPHDNG